MKLPRLLKNHHKAEATLCAELTQGKAYTRHRIESSERNHLRSDDLNDLRFQAALTHPFEPASKGSIRFQLTELCVRSKANISEGVQQNPAPNNIKIQCREMQTKFSGMQ